MTFYLRKHFDHTAEKKGVGIWEKKKKKTPDVSQKLIRLDDPKD